MKKAAPQGNHQKNKKKNGKQKCALNPSTVRDIEANGVKGVNAVESRKKSAGLNMMNKGVGSTSAKNTRQKRATEHSPPPETASAIGGRSDKHLSRNETNDTESEEEESVSATGRSEEVAEEEISDEEEEEERDGRKESPEGDSSEETPINSSDKGNFGESKGSRGSELDTLASSLEGKEEARDGIPSAGLKDETQDKEISQEDTSERLTGRRTRRRCAQPSSTTKPAKESKYKMFRRSKADKQAEKDEKRRVKAEKQRLEKEAKQKAKEEKKSKKKPLKAEKQACGAKEIQSTGSSRGKCRKANEKNKSEKPAKNPEDVHMSEDSREEDDDDEPALTKAVKGQNRFMHLKGKGKDLRNISAKPQQEISEDEPLVLDSNKVGQCLIAQRKGATALNRVSGWVQKNVPQKLNLRKKLSAWTKAVGISRWLSLKVIKQNPSPKKSERGIVKHRMALRVASKTSLVSRNKMSQEDAGEGGGAVVAGGEKDPEAKYAVVLPRMNEPGKTKTAETSQAPLSPSAPTNMTESPGESSATESRPPKPGARLVLPVKPDLSLLKSIKKSVPGDSSAGAGLSQRTPDSTQRPEGSPKTGESNGKAALENYDGGVGILQAARRKLDPSQINRTKLFLSGGAIGPERDAAAGMPRSNAQPFPNGEARSGVSGAGPVCDEETDREVAQLMCEGGKYGVNQPEVHWAGIPQMSGDPQVGSVIFSLCNTFLKQPSL